MVVGAVGGVRGGYVAGVDRGVDNGDVGNATACVVADDGCVVSVGGNVGVVGVVDGDGDVDDGYRIHDNNKQKNMRINTWYNGHNTNVTITNAIFFIINN